MIRVERILFPTDFSKCSRAALGHALFLAKELDAELHMLHAVILHQDDPSNPALHFPDKTEFLHGLFEVADNELSELATHAEPHALDVAMERRNGYSAAEVILEYADEIKADLIVMGTHGHRGPARLFLGSVAAELVRVAPCPVLTIREGEEAGDARAFENILAPVDFSDHSEEAVKIAKALAARFGAKLQLLHVINSQTLPAVYGAATVLEVTERMNSRSLAALRELGEASGMPDVPVEATVLAGPPDLEIANFASEHECDLIVLPTHGRTGLGRLLLGSTAERTVRTAPCPVLVTRPFGTSLLTEPEEQREEAIPVS